MTESTTATDKPIALVTGGSAGLGLAIARTFLAHGYRVVIVSRSADRLDQAADHLDSPDLITHAANLASREDCQRLAGELGQQFGHVDVLINCVGASDRGVLEELSETRLRELIDQNVTTTLLCCQAFRPLLEKSRGSVVNIGSLAGKVGARYLGGYNAAKHALTGITQQLRLEWRDKGIHVALVSPGPIRRDDAGTRYQDRTGGSVPESAAAPGGGTKVKGLDPQRVARAVLLCAQKRRVDVILPGYLRLLIVLGNAFPRLGDWLLVKFTS